MALDTRAPDEMYPRVSSYTACLKRPAAKALVVLLWGALTLGGVVVLLNGSFLGNLESSIDPVPGTPSYAAQSKLTLYFPEDAATAANGAGALLVESQRGPLFAWSNESTCDVDLALDGLMAGKPTISVTCVPRSPDTLGGGCVTKRDMKTQLLNKILAEIETLLPLLTYLCAQKPVSPPALKPVCDYLPLLNSKILAPPLARAHVCTHAWERAQRRIWLRTCKHMQAHTHTHTHTRGGGEMCAQYLHASSHTMS